MKPLFLALLLLLCPLLVVPAFAQTTPAVLVEIAHQPGHLVLATLNTARGRSLQVVFDTDGEAIGGLSQVELNKRFSQTTSVAAMLNFVVQHGYKIQSLSVTQASTYGGTGNTCGGTDGYAVLFGRIR